MTEIIKCEKIWEILRENGEIYGYKLVAWSTQIKSPKYQTAQEFFNF